MYVLMHLFCFCKYHDLHTRFRKLNDLFTLFYFLQNAANKVEKTKYWLVRLKNHWAQLLAEVLFVDNAVADSFFYPNVSLAPTAVMSSMWHSTEGFLDIITESYAIVRFPKSSEHALLLCGGSY